MRIIFTWQPLGCTVYFLLSHLCFSSYSFSTSSTPISTLLTTAGSHSSIYPLLLSVNLISPFFLFNLIPFLSFHLFTLIPLLSYLLKLNLYSPFFSLCIIKLFRVCYHHTSYHQTTPVCSLLPHGRLYNIPYEQVSR